MDPMGKWLEDFEGNRRNRGTGFSRVSCHFLSSRKYKKLANRVKFSYTFQSSLFIQQERMISMKKTVQDLKICLWDPPTRSARDGGTIWNWESRDSECMTQGSGNHGLHRIRIYYPMTDPYVWYIWCHIYHQYTPNVSIYTIHTDPMGMYISVYKIRRLMMINACQVMIDHLAYFSMSFMSLQDSRDMLTCWRVDVSMLIGTLRRSGTCEAALRYLRHLHFRRLALSQHRRERVTQHGCNGDNRS